jgi:hypothetical protein
MAERYRGRVQAWEPWNEANIRDFGAHPIDEISSFQKAAFLGFKAGDPDLTVCWNVHASVPSWAYTTGVLENECWPYFDTYNIHTYEWPHDYAELWAPARAAACGRPIWVTEADRGTKYATDPPWCELSRHDERLKAEWMAQAYANSLFAGCNRHFHFILGHYYEARNGVQFGLLRLDKTPRPAYVALAAVGRFLAGARCLGRWTPPGKPEVNVYAFRARPDGVERDVLVAWAEQRGDWPTRGKTQVDWPLPDGLAIAGVYDYLGRSLGAGAPVRLQSAPVFVLMPPGEARNLALETPPAPSGYRTGAPSPIVLQLRVPDGATTRVAERPWSQIYERTCKAGGEQVLEIFAYNFGDRPAGGTVLVEHVPPSWQLTPRRAVVTLEPMERRRLAFRLVVPTGAAASPRDNTVRLRGRFDSLPPAALAVRFAIE